MKVLIELRPALDGHSGIPQETRLLFSELASLDGVEVMGLIQSSNLVLEPGLTPTEVAAAGTVSAAHRAIDRMSQVVASLQQGSMSGPIEWVRRRLLLFAGPVAAWLGSLFGRLVPLGVFDSTHFKDFVWRAMFAKSLPPSDFELVTSRGFRVMRWPWAVLHAAGWLSARLGRALYLRLDTRGIDVLVVETPYPARVAKRTRMVVRYHDAIPLMMPHTIKDRGFNRAAHYNALHRNVRDGAWFACVSEATRRDLLAVFPEVAPRAVTIPNIIPKHFHFESAPANRVVEIMWSRKNRSAPHGGGEPVASADLIDGALPYLLMVATVEPRKNHLTLLDAWELLRSEGFPQMNLVFIGSLGWEHESILSRCGPWLQRGGLHLLEGVPAADLRLLYRHARATVCPSLGEGFDFPGIEAMCCGGVVAASDLPVHRDVFGQACEYFNPYDAKDLVRSIRHVIGPAGRQRRDELVAAGARVSALYSAERVLPQWDKFLRNVVQ